MYRPPPCRGARTRRFTACRIPGVIRGEPLAMFGWFKKRGSQPTRDQLVATRLRLLAQARDLQRNGDIVGFAAKTAEAEAVERQIEALDGAAATPAKS